MTWVLHVCLCTGPRLIGLTAPAVVAQQSLTGVHSRRAPIPFPFSFTSLIPSSFSLPPPSATIQATRERPAPEFQSAVTGVLFPPWKQQQVRRRAYSLGCGEEGQHKAWVRGNTNLMQLYVLKEFWNYFNITAKEYSAYCKDSSNFTVQNHGQLTSQAQTLSMVLMWELTG